MITELLIYEMFARICRAFPAEYEYTGGPLLTCRRPNTFAVLDGITDLDAPNLNKSAGYQDKPYYFNRRYEQSGRNQKDIGFEYPILAVVPNRVRMSLDQQYDEIVLNFALFDQDVYPSSCKAIPCLNRTAEQQASDMLRIITRVFKQVEYFYHYTDQTGKHYLLTESEAATMPNMTQHEPASSLMNSQAVDFQYQRGIHNDNVSGVFGRISFYVNYCVSDQQFTYITPQAAAATNYCESC